MIDKTTISKLNNFYSSKVIKYDLSLENDVNNNVYHYTNIDSLEQIIKNQTLWISKSSYLNDKTELNYTFDLIYKIYGNGKKYKNITKKRINAIIDMIKNSLEESYILSFSVNSDSLILWGNYSKFEGYNLDFNIKKLFHRITDGKVYITTNEKDHNGKFKKIKIDRNHNKKKISIVSGKIIYKLEEQKKIIEHQLNCLDYLYENYYTSAKISKDYKNKFYSIIIKLCQTLATYVQLFKDPSFEQEEEYRILLTLNEKMNIIKFRKCSGIFIPYIEIVFLDYDSFHEKGLPIEGIKIGPKNNMDIAINGLKSFLESESYNTVLENEFINKNNCVVLKKSKIPLRY